MKKTLLIFIIISVALFFLFLSPFSVLAQRGLSVDYPDIPGVETPTTTQTPLTIFLRYVYSFSVFIAGFIAFVMLIRGGVRYVSSAGKPVQLKEARNQIGAAVLGMIIVFSSYLILNTINPQLVLFNLPNILVNTPSITIPPGMDVKTIEFQEIPVGTLITAEFGASSFIATDQPDPDCDCKTYGNAFPDVGAYPENYQGALHGRRLKRVHEVASTTLPIAKMLVTLSEELVEVVKELEDADRKLYAYAMECNCLFCNCSGCGIPMLGPCNSCPDCSGDPCPHRAEMNDLRENIIPSFYEEEDDPIPCKMVEFEYFISAFKPFLDNSSQLVKNEKYQGQSYWYTGIGLYSGATVDEMRSKIQACISAGEIEQKQYDEIEKLIDLMAEVENKGTRSPKTDPPERDIETNILHLEIILLFLEQSKTILNPEHPAGCFPQPYSFLQRDQLADALGVGVGNFKINPVGDVDVKEDPATFYCPLGPVIDSPRETMLLEDVPTETTCGPMVEIPIGKALDEAIRLTTDILRELGDPGHITRVPWDPQGLGKKGIWNMGHLIIDNFLEQSKLAKETTKLSDDLIELTSEDNCLNQCQDVPCESQCIQVDIPTPLGVISGHMCLPCTGPHPCRTFAQIVETWGKIQANVAMIEKLYNNPGGEIDSILEAKERIYDAFYKLNSKYPDKDPQHPSGHPRAGQRVTIGENICCNDATGYCRNPDTGQLIFSNDKAEKRGYTLIEKLVEVQKLLNRARDFVTYTLLIEELLEIEKKVGVDLADREEINNVPVDLRLNLSNCDVLVINLAEQAEAGLTPKLLENCWLAKPVNFNHIWSQICSLDPPYDCEYFNERFPEKKSNMLCYCFEQAFYPDLTNNFFCCHIR